MCKAAKADVIRKQCNNAINQFEFKDKFSMFSLYSAYTAKTALRKNKFNIPKSNQIVLLSKQNLPVGYKNDLARILKI